LRDPRVENTVVNLELPPGERNRNLQELAREDFATRTPTRVTSVEKGRLYLVEIKEAEHRMRLGLAIALDAAAVGKDSDGYDIFKVGWFVMGRLVQGRLVQSKNGWKVKNPSFVQYKQRGQLVTDDIGLRSFRLLVEDCDLTSKGLADKETAPKFRQDFGMRVQCFAREEKLSSAGTEDELSTDCSDCEEGAEAEGEEDGNEWADDVDEQDEEEDGEDEQDEQHAEDEEDEEDEHEGDDQRCGDVDEEDEEMQEEEGAEEDAEVQAPPRGEKERKREPRGAGGSSTESGETAKGAGAARADGGGRKRGSRAAKVASPRGAAGRKRVLRSVSQMGQGR
jgi:hypothetical protein